MGGPLAPYPEPSARDEALRRACAEAGGTVRVVGESVEGRELLLADLPGPSADAPVVLVTANIHGPEFISSQVALGLLERAAANDEELVALRRAARVCVLPCLNPDGYARTVAAEGRGALASLRANAKGVDLNRNFPLPEGERRWPLPGAGSSSPDAATYRGPEPASEPETRAVCELAAELRPRITFGLHSFMGTLIPARTRRRNHYKKYKELCAEISAAQPRWHYRRLSSRVFDVFTGEQEDYLHHTLDSWALCLESFSVAASFKQHLRAPSLFWRFNPHDPAPWVENDVAAILAGARAALQMPRPSELDEG